MGSASTFNLQGRFKERRSSTCTSVILYMDSRTQGTQESLPLGPLQCKATFGTPGTLQAQCRRRSGGGGGGGLRDGKGRGGGVLSSSFFVVLICTKGLAQSVASTKIPSKFVFVSSFSSFFIFIRFVLFAFGFCNEEASSSSNFFVLFLFLFVVVKVVVSFKVVIFRTRQQTQHERGGDRNGGRKERRRIRVHDS